MRLSPLRLQVFVYNYVKMGPNTLASAEAETSRVFLRADVTLVWHNCIGTPGVQVDECSSSANPNAIEVRVIRRARPSSKKAEFDALGYAAGILATVGYDKCRQMSKEGEADDALVLGDAIAHELGHILMPGRPHSGSGIMCGLWSSLDMQRIGQQCLNFLPEEGPLVQAGVERLGGNSPVASVR